jgi:hypothetical protein
MEVVKKSVSPTAVRSPGTKLDVGSKSSTRAVPSGVPSLRHNSNPAPSSAMKYSVPFAFTKLRKFDGPLPG